MTVEEENKILKNVFNEVLKIIYSPVFVDTSFFRGFGKEILKTNQQIEDGMFKEEVYKILKEAKTKIDKLEE
jgi:hypothetical protein